MSSSLVLGGCRARPLGEYLKALGVLRIVGGQADPDARGWWHGDTFRLDTSLAADDLVDFFMDRYAPTPVVSPWNGGSGFAAKDQQAGIEAIERSDSPRFATYRAAIEVGRDLVAGLDWGEGKDAKPSQIARCRAALPDEAVDWLDAAVVLAGDRPTFPPIFGTGGNDGRLDFSNNFMQRLAEIFLLPRRRSDPDPTRWLRGALFGEDPGPLRASAGGQYAPSATESGVSSPTGAESKLLNPWSFILLMEGGLTFASSASRRLGEGAGIRAAMPFCVDSSPVGHPSAAPGEETRGEIWAPLWHRPASAVEIARLVGEGRASWRGADAANGLDFAKAVATLGVDRGIDRFVRHGLVQRFGLSYLAVPLGEVVVGERPEVRVLSQVDRWIGRLPRGLPAAVDALRRRVDVLEFRTATTTEPSARHLQDVLVAVADLETGVSKSGKLRTEVTPVGARGTALSAKDWLPLLDDGSVELRLAVALASARDRYPSGTLAGPARSGSSLAMLVRPVTLDGQAQVVWRPGGARVAGLGTRPIDVVLADSLDLRFRDVRDRVEAGEPSVKGAVMGWDLGNQAEVADLVALVEGRADLDRLGALLRGLVLLDWRAADGPGPRPRRPRDPAPRRVPPELAVVMPFFQRGSLPAPDGREVWLRPAMSWGRLLASGSPSACHDVLVDALRRLRISGCEPGPRAIRPNSATTGPRLAVATLCPLGPGDAARWLRLVCPTPSDLGPEPQIETHQEDLR